MILWYDSSGYKCCGKFAQYLFVKYFKTNLIKENLIFLWKAGFWESSPVGQKVSCRFA